MRIGHIFYDMQAFGGLEEYAVTLAGALKEVCGHEVAVFSTAWVQPDNQYLLRLQVQGIPVIQPPRWLSLAASDWATKEKILVHLLTLLMPIVYLLAVGLKFRGRTWSEAATSARNWLQGQLMSRLIGPDRREPLARLLLTWWRLRWRPDILHIQGYTTNLLFVIEWANACGLPTAYEEHQTPDPQFDWWQGFQGSINKADTVIAVSAKSATGLRAVCGVTRPIVVRAPQLPDPLPLGRPAPSPALRSDDTIQMTTVARLAVAKGLPYLLEAAQQVLQTHPQARFRVYGDGEMREQLLARAAELGLPGAEIFPGPFTSRAQLTEIMAQTDIFVMSSILEGQPLGVIEAMAYGCPIVTTAVGGIPEVIEDGYNGLLCPAHDPACLADKIRQLIDDPTKRAELGWAARRSYEAGPYQPADLAANLTAIYEATLRQEQELVLEIA